MTGVQDVCSSDLWNNFTPLISESLSMQFNNLIVGDVKQSIYRWRNSDWSLLHSQIKSFNSDQRVDNILDTNWRSADSIVKFNNSFFTVASFLLQEKYNSETELTDNTIIEAYNDINQFVSPSNISNEGHVIVDFIDYEKKEDYIESALERLPPIIETMIENGATMKDIAILVRTGKEGTLIANYLLKYKEENPDSICRFDIISNDSLYISQSKIIETIISFMRFILNDEVECNEFIASYNILTKFRNQNENDALEYYFSNKDRKSVV